MKKRHTATLTAVIILAAMLLTSCRSSDSAATESNQSASGSVSDTAPSESYELYNYEEPDAKEIAETDGGEEGAGLSGQDTANSSGYAEDLSEKIIYTASVEIQTTDFEYSIRMVQQMVDDYGAYIESSYVSGKSYGDTYYGNQTYRYAQYTVRVPSREYTDFTEFLNGVGYITGISEDTENITLQFYDSQSRLEAYEVEEERLLEMLEKADTVDAMLVIESRLTEVRYEIESLTTTLRIWQNQVDYSTVNITIDEVREITENVPVQRTYWEEMGDGLKSSLKGVARFFKNLFMNLIISLPALLVAAVFIVIIILLAKKFLSAKARELRAERKARKDKKRGGDSSEDSDDSKENK